MSDCDGPIDLSPGKVARHHHNMCRCRVAGYEPGPLWIHRPQWPYVALPSTPQATSKRTQPAPYTWTFSDCWDTLIFLIKIGVQSDFTDTDFRRRDLFNSIPRRIYLGLKWARYILYLSEIGVRDVVEECSGQETRHGEPQVGSSHLFSVEISLSPKTYISN